MRYRNQVRERIVELARTDARITGGALTGSTAFEEGDDWSDVDVAFGVLDGVRLEIVLQDWMQALDQEFGVLDYFDLLSGSSIYRVFLLTSGLEVDVAVTPEAEFGARGPHFRALFGSHHQLESGSPPNSAYLVGLCWHHVYHARSYIERHKPWRAEYWISEVRNHILELASIRLGVEPYHRRGVDHLPANVTTSLADALVRSLDEPELRRALATVTLCLLAELEQWDTNLSARLKPFLLEIGSPLADAGI